MLHSNMGRRAQRLKIAVLNLMIVALALAAGYLGWQNLTLQQTARDLRDTVGQLERERRDLTDRLAAASDGGAKPEDQAELRRLIERQTSELRELPFQQPLTYNSLTRPELHDVLTRLIDEQYTPDELRRYTRALETLGVIPVGTDLRQLWLGLYGEQVGAFYVPEERALYTFKDLSLSGALDRMMLAHELTHALQDQNFDLTKFPLKVKDNDDLALATAALLEGDATVLMTQFYTANFDRAHLLRDLGAMLSQQTQNLQDAPSFMRELLLFPYQQGQKFAMTLYLRGGMAELNRAFANPPTSTEQILHPERYLGNRDEPTPVTLPKVKDGEWQMIFENVLGEFGVREMLRVQVRITQAQLAAQGWDGDRYQVYERGPAGPTALVWHSVWDSEQDAVDFAEAYQAFAARRGLEPEVNRDGIHVRIMASEEKSFYAWWRQHALRP